MRPLRVSRVALAFAFVVIACAESNSGSERPAGSSLGEGSSACHDGCTLDLRQTCEDGAPRATCAEPLGCYLGNCVPPCAVAEGHGTTAGCSFFSAVPDATLRGGCFAIVLANPSAVSAKVAIEYDGVGIDVARILRSPRGRGRETTYERLAAPEIPPGEIAIAFVADGGAGAEGACPAALGGAGIAIDVAQHGPGIGKAFHVRSSAPITAHAIYPFGGGSTGSGAATALFPVHSWDKNAIAVEVNLSHGEGPLLQIVSAEGDSAISFTPAAAVHGGGPILSSTPAGQKIVFRHGTGDLVQFSQLDPFSLTGSFVEASRPVGLFAGSACASSGVAACDPLFQQIPPLKHLGSEYVAVRHRDRFAGREEQTPWHLVGLFDGTQLVYEPAAPEGAPAALRAGQIVQFRSSRPFVVRSQDGAHPFYAAAMMESCRVYGTDDDCRGDPEIVSLVPTSRYGQRAGFFADPSYPETNLVIVRASLDSKFERVELDCLPTVEGWEPLGSRFEIAHVDLSTGNFEPRGPCNSGAHTLRSAGPITASIWGWGSAATRSAGGPNTESVSYGYAIVAEPRIDVMPAPQVPR